MSAAPETETDVSRHVGTTIAEKYRIDALLGVGGMGAVFRAHHLLLKRDVAVKILHPELTENPQVSLRFDREAQSAARLEHPNVIHVTEYGSTDEGMKYMVMQLLSGTELVSLLSEGPLPPARAVELMIQILRGLEHAHERGVIHRDLKPENVFVTRDHDRKEILKIVDFGIAKIAGGDGDSAGDAEPLTRLGLVFGTPQYMSPEQATGMQVDVRSDLYSAGIIFYEMLAGGPPFVSDDPVALIRMQVSLELPPLPGLSPHLAGILAGLTAKSRDARLPDATTARVALEQFQATEFPGMNGEPSGPLPISSSGPISRPMALGSPAVLAATMAAPLSRSRPRWLPIAAGAAVATLVFAWFFRGANSDPATDISGNPAAVAATSGETSIASAPPTSAGPSPTELAEIDGAVGAQNGDAALKLIKPLRDRFPKDADLLWREGRALTLLKSKEGTALTRYGEALQERPPLLDNPSFRKELDELMAVRRLRDQALDLALQHMGAHGVPFLLSHLNEPNPKRTLSYVDRHRALDHLAHDPENATLVDRRLNLARDLWQSHQSPTPCASFATALEAIAAEPDAYFLAPIQNATLPQPREGGGDDATACEPLAKRLAAVRLQLETAFGTAPVGASGETAANAVDDPAEASKPKPKPKPKEERRNGAREWRRGFREAFGGN